MPDTISAYFIARFLLPLPMTTILTLHFVKVILEKPHSLSLRYSPWLPKFATQGFVLMNHFPFEY